MEVQTFHIIKFTCFFFFFMILSLDVILRKLALRISSTCNLMYIHCNLVRKFILLSVPPFIIFFFKQGHVCEMFLFFLMTQKLVWQECMEESAKLLVQLTNLGKSCQ